MNLAETSVDSCASFIKQYYPPMLVDNPFTLR